MTTLLSWLIKKNKCFGFFYISKAQAFHGIRHLTDIGKLYLDQNLAHVWCCDISRYWNFYVFYSVVSYLFMTDWEVNVKSGPVLFLTNQRIKNAAGTKGVCCAPCDWYCLMVHAIRRAKDSAWWSIEGSAFLFEPTEALETELPKGLGSKALLCAEPTLCTSFTVMPKTW